MNSLRVLWALDLGACQFSSAIHDPFTTVVTGCLAVVLTIIAF